MFMFDFIGLKFNQDMAFKYPMIKYRVDKKVFISDCDALLLSLKTESIDAFNF